MKSARTRAAFTLIELLIVIALMSILMALAIPGLLGSRKAAKEGDVISVMRELITAQELFKARSMGRASRYGSLAELVNTPVGNQALIHWPDPAHPRVRNEYLFEELEAPTVSTWMVRASPQVPGVSGDLYFAAGEDGYVRRAPAAPVNRAAEQTMGILPN